MQISPLAKTVLGVYFIVVGLLLIMFHRQVKGFYDDWFASLWWAMRFSPRGAQTAIIIVFGVLSIIGGALLLASIV